MSGREIKKWRLNEREVTVVVSEKNEVSFNITSNDKTVEQKIIMVTGVPEKALANPLILEALLAKTHVRLGDLGNNEFNLHVTQDGPGGANIINPRLEPQKLWPGGVIPFEIDSAKYPVGLEERKIILAAIEEWNNAGTGFRIVPRTTETDYLIFGEDSDACYSNVGHTGGAQYIRCHLHGGAFNKGSIIHEIGHAVGFHHEHQRRDRDNYLQLTKPTRPNDPNYGKQGMRYGEYDFDSIMHYSTQPLTDGQQMAVKPNINHPYSYSGGVIGESQTLSAGDIAAAKHLYQFAIAKKPNPQPSERASSAALVQSQGLLRKPQWIVLHEKADDFFARQNYVRASYYYAALLYEYDGQLTRGLKTELNNKCGVCAYRNREYQNAKDWFETALVLNPNDRTIQDNLYQTEQKIMQQLEYDFSKRMNVRI